MPSLGSPGGQQPVLQQPPAQQPQAAPSDILGHAAIGKALSHFANALEGKKTVYQPQADGTIQETQVPRKAGGFFRDIITGAMYGLAAAGQPSPAGSGGALGLGRGFAGAQQQAQGQDSQARNRALQNAQLQKQSEDASTKKANDDQLAQAAIAKSTVSSLAIGHNVGLHNDDDLAGHNASVDVIKKQALANGGALAQVDGNGEPGNGPALMAKFNQDPTIMQGPEGFHRIPSISYDTSGLEHKDGQWVDPKTGKAPDWNERATVSLIDLPNSAWGKTINVSKKDANAVAGRQVASGKDDDQVQTTFGSLFGLGLKNLDKMNADRQELYRTPKTENEAKGWQAEVKDIRDRMNSDDPKVRDSVTQDEKNKEAVKGPMMDAYKFKTQAPTATSIKLETEALEKKAAANAADPTKPALTPDERATLIQRQKSDPAATKGVPADIIAAIGARPVPAQFANGEDDPAYKAALKLWGKSSVNTKTAMQAASGLARYQMLGQIRDYNITNTTDQPIQTPSGVIQPGEMGRVTANDAAKMPPGAILNTQDGTKIMAKGAAIRDIQYNIDSLKQSLPAIDDLSASQKMKVLTALRDPNSSSLSNLLSAEAKEFSDPKVQKAVNDLAYMKENVMLMRSIQGIGGSGSDQMREALFSLVPNAASVGVKGYGPMQLSRLQGTLNQLKTGVPTVGGQNLNAAGAKPAAAGGAPAASPPLNLLKEGTHTTFGNGQTWTLQGGKPVQVQ
jgi:hypothetical protein